jgi:Uma2 family endonuclease
MSYQEFLEWCDEDTLAEWVDGEVVMYSPASWPHQRVGGFLHLVVGHFVGVHDLGQVIPPPFQMKTGKDLPGREPDLLFVAKAHRDRLKQTFLDGPADLVAEIVSPDSRLRDTGAKFAEYAEGGVPEYWLIDPDRRQADFYLLDPRRRYRLVEADAQGWYASAALPGFRLKVDWLWADPPPRLPEVLRQLGLFP